MDVARQGRPRRLTKTPLPQGPADLAHTVGLMNPFNKLPGFQRSPPGWERAIWRRLPVVWLWGTLLPVLWAVLQHWLVSPAPSAAQERALLLGDYTMLGVVALHWTLVLTVAVGCVVVMIMKGPAYVADAYPPADRDTPLTDRE